ncbi:PREDICTED: uncharacterized protein LOC106102574 [Papilio polytes]|uniref:uncharacterized protein LOC106102574 n=1 Tax=Papilio polytes TaxID=76194 RepID=UPI0006767141|nr:PREDICTED: uncharacterized protein LOC106102574 [Papilio polytes]
MVDYSLLIQKMRCLLLIDRGGEVQKDMYRSYASFPTSNLLLLSILKKRGLKLGHLSLTLIMRNASGTNCITRLLLASTTVKLQIGKITPDDCVAGTVCGPYGCL